MSVKDKEELVLNPVTKKLDMVVKFNPDRILTAELNAAGNPRMIWDAVSQSFIADGPDIVVDNKGNVVVKG